MPMFKVLGAGLMLVALVAAALDHARSAMSWHIGGVSVGELWGRVSQESLDFVRTAAERHLPAQIGNPGLQAVLDLPAWVLVGFIGFMFFAIGALRRRRMVSVTPDCEGNTEQDTRLEPQDETRSELAQALSACRSAFVSIGVFSAVSNVLMLTGAFFMLQIYDRVLPSRSIPTLVALAALVVGLFAFLAIIDMIKSRILVRIGGSLDDALGARVYDLIIRAPLRLGDRSDGLQPLRDLDAVRGFLSGPGPTALFDLPWMPFYIAIIFSFHTALGIAALVGAIILVGLTFLTEVLARKPMKAASGFGQTRNSLAESSRRNAEVLAAMGMSKRMSARWRDANERFLACHHKASDVTGGLGSVSKALRMLLQSTVLGIGAYLVIQQAATAGIIIAAAILVARALAPVDLAIANWKGFVAARQSWKRLTEIFQLLPALRSPMALPAPSANLSVEQASAVPPGSTQPVVRDVSFALESGQGLGVIGPSGSGKSSLVRLIVGAWRPVRGQIRLDGAASDQWSQEALGRHIGYLPQDVELFSGSVAENIARFEPEAPPEAIIAAAQSAGVHDLIVSLPQGYETEIGEGGQVLSAGQRQRVALARALYGEPFLVVLDEPNSNLDSEGETALAQAILGVRKRGGIVIVIAHRQSALAAADLILVMANGNAVNFGPKTEVLAKVMAQRSAVQRPPLTVVPESGTTA